VVSSPDLLNGGTEFDLGCAEAEHAQTQPTSDRIGLVFWSLSQLQRYIYWLAHWTRDTQLLDSISARFSGLQSRSLVSSFEYPIPIEWDPRIVWNNGALQELTCAFWVTRLSEATHTYPLLTPSLACISRVHPLVIRVIWMPTPHAAFDAENVLYGKR